MQSKKNLLLIVFLFLFLVSCSGIENESILSATKGEMNLSLSITPNPPLSMENTTMRITLTDSAQLPIESAKVTVDLSMPSMQMPMNKPTVIEEGQGIYTVDAMFTMAGEWQILIQVSANGNEEFTFPLTVK